MGLYFLFVLLVVAVCKLLVIVASFKLWTLPQLVTQPVVVHVKIVHILFDAVAVAACSACG